MDNRAKFIEQIHSRFPRLAVDQIQPLVAGNLISAFTIDLPNRVLQQAQAFVGLTYRLRQHPVYQQKLARRVHPNLQEQGLELPGNNSICMSYDFHLDAQSNLQLIEINTNAAFLALGEIAYESQGLPSPVKGFSLDQFYQCIQHECDLNGRSAPKRIAIIDDKPESQRLFIEFLVFQELLRKQGWTVDILDFRADLSSYDFIYNRYTDFYLREPQSEALKQLFNSKKVCLSPQPTEYFFLADKGRMIDWGSTDFTADLPLTTGDRELLAQVVPASWSLSPSNADEIWTRRKQLFFKPQQAFGSKQSYKGASVSRRVFDEIVQQNFIAQSYCQAPEIERETDTGVQKFKYDLRVYAYQDQVQSVIARVYQGQTTNLQTPMGGFATLRWTP